MAVFDFTVRRSSEFRFEEYFWGEHLLGIKADIQSLGIGRDMAFPGETDGPPRCLYTVDPRGFPVGITRRDERVYSVSITFPGRERTSDEGWIEYAHGVMKSGPFHLYWGDEYVGTEAALVAAGLVDPAHFPGKPGMRKTSVRVASDGAVLQGPSNRDERQAAGTKRIERKGKTGFRVYVHLSKEEVSQRLKEHYRRNDEFETRMRALPRPPSLLWFTAQSRPRNRDHLRLAWSRPDIRSLPFWKCPSLVAG